MVCGSEPDMQTEFTGSLAAGLGPTRVAPSEWTVTGNEVAKQKIVPWTDVPKLTPNETNLGALESTIDFADGT